MNHNISSNLGPDKLNDLVETVESLLDEAKRQGASAAEAGLSVEQGLSVTARLGDVETIEHHKDQGLGVTVYIGQRKGSASTTDLRQNAVKETVGAACRIARYATEDAFAGLPDRDRMATEFLDLDLNHPWDINADGAVDLAIECESAAMEYHADIKNSEGANVDTHQGLRVLGNSHGFIHGFPSTRHSLVCTVLGERGNSMQRDYWYSVSRRNDQLESACDVGRKAAERTLRRLQARSLSTRQCPVIYSAEIASGLIGHFVAAIRGGNLYRKSSFLQEKLGQQLFASSLRIHEQPFLKGAIGSASYDSEGVACQTHDIVQDGVLKSYLLSSYSARKLNLQTTGNAGGVHNLCVESTGPSQSELLKEMGTGLLVTELMGQGVNIVTGDYSRGAAGFWVENGEVQYPVEEITVAGNLLDMFSKITAVGSDVDIRSNTRTGSILIEEMTVAGGVAS